MRPALQFLEGELARLEAAGLRRDYRVTAPGCSLDACSNDYLGYGTACGEGLGGVRWGARGSRLVVGDSDEVRALEEEVASWVGQEAGLVFTSGYAANVGVVGALAGRGDRVVSDELCHASLIDGCRLSGADVKVVRHRDVAGVARALAEAGGRRRWVVVESYYSMEGTIAPLGELRQVCDQHGAGLIVDEAHALGVFGPGGAGVCRVEGVVADVVVGTFGKAVGVQGAFVASDAVAAEWLWNRARSFVFSTGMSPAVAGKVLENVRRVRLDEAGRGRLHANASRFRARAAAAGLRVLAGSVGPIVPVIVGAAEACVEVERKVARLGVRVKAIRPPTVPQGTARLRVTLRATMTRDDVDRVADAVAGATR
jgi:8-amino-7-oxononanoate synthase